ncbi:MAG: TraB/GumN family protein [Pseudomonadota bacterium]
MFKTLSRAFAAFALLFAPAAYAQEAKDADPALWVVKDADTTIYLFGTIHFLKPGLGWFDEAVKAAFDKSDQVMLEMVEPDAATAQATVLRVALDPTGPTVSSSLPEDKRAAYAAALTGVGVPPAYVEHADPWLSAIYISVLSLPKYGYDPASGAEKVISAAAAAAGKPVAGLETFEQQLGYFDSLPRELQVKFLVATLDQLPELEPTLARMLATWTQGDPDALGRLMNEDMDGMPEIRRALLTDRNARWADWIGERMKQPGTVFVAVGAGHLAGPDSVQAFLAKRHLRAVRVRY